MSVPVGPEPGSLLRQAQAGDGAALGAALDQYRHYQAVLVRLNLGRRLQGKVDASDLVQETFLRAHQHFAQFRGATEKEFLNLYWSSVNRRFAFGELARKVGWLPITL
jgi:DNA-directed RNA polymerase specialized sigma24 family protein